MRQISEMSFCRKCGLLFQLRTGKIDKAWLTASTRGFFRLTKKIPADDKEERRKIQEDDGDLTVTQLNRLTSLTKTLTAHKSYFPPSDVEARVERVVHQVAADKVASDWRQTSLDDPRLKFKILSRLISEFDHDIPGTTMTSLRTVDDAVVYFLVGVKETATLEDMKAISTIPPNLHINTEYIRFNPETDTMFEGRTAFPGRNTIVTSIKYRRKYEDIKTTKPKPGFENHYYNY